MLRQIVEKVNNYKLTVNSVKFQLLKIHSETH